MPDQNLPYFIAKTLHRKRPIHPYAIEPIINIMPKINLLSCIFPIIIVDYPQKGGIMKRILLLVLILFVVPVFGQTYTDTEFIVEGEPTTTQPVIPQPGISTVTTTTTTSSCVPPATTTVVTTTTEQPIYVGMNKYHVVEVLGQPTYVEKFRRFAGRQQGIYDEIWTYQTPTGTTVVYIKERRVMKVEYR